MRGGQHQVLLLLNGLREAGHDCVLFARKHAPLAAAAASIEFTVYPAGVTEVMRQSKQATLVHAHDARAHTIAAVAARCPFVVSRRVAFPVGRSTLSAWKYRRAARFLAVSEYVAAELRAAGILEELIDVVYDGVEFPPHPAHWSAEWPAVGLASRDLLKGRDLLEKASALAGIPVVFSDNLPEDLRRASMFVYITRSEGLGSAALLAMSMGVPVIGSRVDGLMEVFSNGISGLFVENAAEEIARAMQRLWADPELARKLGEQGRHRVAEFFTKEHMIRRTLLSYERALVG